MKPKAENIYIYKFISIEYHFLELITTHTPVPIKKTSKQKHKTNIIGRKNCKKM